MLKGRGSYHFVQMRQYLVPAILLLNFISNLTSSAVEYLETDLHTLRKQLSFPNIPPVQLKTVIETNLGRILIKQKRLITTEALSYNIHAALISRLPFNSFCELL